MFHRMKSEELDEEQSKKTPKSEVKSDTSNTEKEQDEKQDNREKKAEAMTFKSSQTAEQDSSAEVAASTNPSQSRLESLRSRTLRADQDRSNETETPSSSQSAKDTTEMTQKSSKTTDTDNTEQDPAITEYQRAGQAPVRAAGNSNPYSGSYNRYGSNNASEQSPSTGASGSDRRLTIGAGITMSGEIESCDYLLVEGTVEAALKGASMLEVAESGTFYGTVEISEAHISGRFEGDIAVDGRLTITSSGTVTGTISYKELEVEAGAVIDGKLTPMAQSGAQSSSKKPSKSASSSSKSQEPANSDGELFSKAAAAAE